jgi:phytoene dehydrogenase-like protein
MKEFDVIIIGSGIGGLVSAGLLVSQGLKPLVVEAHTRPGGYLSSFRRNEYIFDSAVDCISGTGPDGLIGRVLSLLDVVPQIEFLPVEPIRRSMFPDFDVDVCGDIEEYKKNLKRLFPHEGKGINDFFRMTGRIYEEVVSSITLFAGNNRSIAISHDAVKLMNMTYEDILKDYISDPRLRAVLADRCPFIGLSPSSVAALPMIMLVMSYFRLGAFRPRGGFQELPDLIVGAIKDRGGDVILGNEIKKIILDGDRCQRVLCESGDEYYCKYLIANSDYIHTFSNLLGGGYRDMAKKMSDYPGASTSFFIVYGSITGKFNGHSSIGYFPSYDFPYFFNTESEFRDDSTIGITVASVEDHGRAPEGSETIVLHEMVNGNRDWSVRQQCAEMMVKKTEKALPDLKGRIQVIDTATPVTLQRYTKNHRGAAFGWRPVPGNFMTNGHGLKNFHIAGHWSEMGGGVLAAAYSGAKAAAAILTKEGISLDA